MKKPRVSLFLTTYNWPQALTLCLQSLMHQTVLPDEVIVADDGSGEATRQVVEHFKTIAPFDLVHCWQPDDGYRINAIRNKAIAAASHPYIIQLDGDIIAHLRFVADHLAFARPGRFVIGRRNKISKADTQRFCEDGKADKLHSFRNSLVAILHQQLLYNHTSVKGVRGCNVAFWKEDAYKVNGYDLSMTSKGPNDKEFCARLVNAGVKAYNLKFYAIAYHLHHGEEGLRTNYEQVNGIYRETLTSGKVTCSRGLNEI